MKLSERKKKILKAVVQENIKRAEPISSSELKEKYMHDISSATIRNELVALEEMGFLSQPHTSSGRVPTPLAFRMYADELVGKVKPTASELNKIKENFNKKIVDMEDFARSTAKIISSATNYASVVNMKVGDDALIETIKIIKISSSQALVVVVTDVGVIKDIIINTAKGKDEQFFDDASKFLTGIFKEKSIATLSTDELITEKVEKFKLLFDMVVQVVSNREDESMQDLAVEGTSNLFEYPEYTSPEKAKQALKLFENKKELYPLIKSQDGLEINIKVGGDENSNFENCSLVSATYKVNGKEVGNACVIGPVRMDYEKAIKVLKGVSESLSQCFDKGEEDD